MLDPKFSPDGASIAFVYEHDIWVVSVAGGKEKQLTFGGSELVLHGDLDWVYPEELEVPGEDPEAYKRMSSIVDAGNNNGRTLIIHGSHDDNVHPQNTFKLIDALIENQKQFDLMFYPNKTHGIRGTNAVIHLWTMVFDYMERHLK